MKKQIEQTLDVSIALMFFLRKDTVFSPVLYPKSPTMPIICAAFQAGVGMMKGTTAGCSPVDPDRANLQLVWF